MKKKRTIISLAPDDKKWLDQEAKQTRQTMTQVVREAIQEYRVKKEEQAKPTFKELLERTRGTWPHKGDALDYIRKIREDRI